MALDPSSRPVISARCAWQAVQGEAVVIDLQTRRVMGLNPTASHVWCLLDGRASIQELGQAVATEFKVPEEQARADVLTFLDSMAARGLVTV